MHPTLFDLGSVHLPVVGDVRLALPTYGVLFAVGTLLAWTWFQRRTRALGLPEAVTFNLAFYSILAGLLGAKVALIVLDLPYYLRNPAAILDTVRSAGVLLGGVIAGAAVFALYARRHRLPTLDLTDAAVAPVALAQAVGRLGCFSAGCCYGVPASPDNPLAVTFADPHSMAPLHQALVPTQLIQAAHDLLLAVVLALVWRRRPPTGMSTALYLVLYGTGRGIIEFWRGDRERGVFFGGVVSTSQILSLAAIAIGVALAARAWRHRAST